MYPMLQTFVGEKRRRSIHLKIDIKRHTLYRFYQPIIDMKTKMAASPHDGELGEGHRGQLQAVGQRDDLHPPGALGGVVLQTLGHLFLL